MNTIYISGPMTGQPEFNFPAFHEAAARLRAAGFTVVNPAEFGADLCQTWADYMRKDIKALVECDGMAMLPGWAASRGARLERVIAIELGMTVRTVEEFEIWGPA